MIFAVLLLLMLYASSNATLPQNFGALECAVHTFAQAYGAALIPSAATSLTDALNIELLCNSSTITPGLLSPLSQALSALASSSAAARAAAHAAAMPTSPSAQFFVAPVGGSDSNPGTQGAPFATLPRAAAAARGVTGRTAAAPVAVWLRSGTHYMGDAPLLLTEADSNVTWAAFPGDAGAPVILSGARLLSSLAWEPATVPSGAAGVLRAPVAVSDARRDAWFASHPGWEGVKAGPPPLVNSLFVGGTRAVRARYPNGNPQDETGICFSATQRPGEGCASYSTCATGSMGTQPAPAAAFTRNGNYPSRGDSPTWGCPQCGGGGLFKDSVYPFPPDHPVYSEPLPGIGFGNLSLYSFWASPFSRPSGVLVSPACDAHWANYSVKGGAADGVVHMFHGGEAAP